MAGSSTTTIISDNDGVQISLSLVADALGACDAASFHAYGYLIEMRCFPGTASDAYDLVLNDSDTLDILNGLGANMSNAAGMTLAEKYLHIIGPNGNYLHFFGDELNLVGSNMGNGGTATIKFIFSRTLK